MKNRNRVRKYNTHYKFKNHSKCYIYYLEKKIKSLEENHSLWQKAQLANNERLKQLEIKFLVKETTKKLAQQDAERKEKQELENLKSDKSFIMFILAIETSCDETSIAVLKDKKVLSNITFSQIFEQEKHGGVMPSLAAKLHLNNIQKVLEHALTKAQIAPQDIDYIAYTEKPGLVICLQIGKVVAETLALYLRKPLINCNHLHAHIYASLLENEKEWKFPVLALIISGGHTQIYYLNNHLDFDLWGETSDDAVGECLDKSAILLGYSYPGGPTIEKLALNAQNTYQLPLPKNNHSLDFSFSGLKSAVRRLVESEGDKLNISNLACSLQYTIAKTLTSKIEKALNKKKFASLVLGGEVVANKFLVNYLKNFLRQNHQSVEIFVPNKKYCTDNAAMVGILAHYQIINSKKK